MLTLFFSKQQSNIKAVWKIYVKSIVVSQDLINDSPRTFA